MNTKIAIKSIFEQILFEYEEENNTIKDTLQKAVSQGINLRGADFRGAYLCSADLCDAYLRDANLRDANLRDANLCGANLCDADLRGANLYGANLCDADLRGANLYGAYLRGAILRGAILRGANLYGADLRGANLEDAGFGSWGTIKESSDILTMGAIGSRDSHTTIYHTDKGIFVQCGCFSGTLEEFVAIVKKKHQGNKHERDYLALVEFAKIKFEL